ncbi:MAG: hypothetical protein ACFFE8_08480 [Candidatus Heimdallarchaeota archaeon]
MVKDINIILKEILREGKKTPGEWKALAAPTPDRSGSDLLIFHPTLGPTYQIRAYEKNPLNIQGLGTKLSRDVDERFLQLLEDRKTGGNLGIINLNFRELQNTMMEGIPFERIFLKALQGEKNRGMDFLNLGGHTLAQSPIPILTKAQERLDSKYKRLVKEDGKTNMYG